MNNTTRNLRLGQTHDLYCLQFSHAEGTHAINTNNCTLYTVGSLTKINLLFCVLCFLQLHAPANTPATPPNFPDILTSFSKLGATPTEKCLGASPMALATSPIQTAQLQPSCFARPNNNNQSMEVEPQRWIFTMRLLLCATKQTAMMQSELIQTWLQEPNTVDRNEAGTTRRWPEERKMQGVEGYPHSDDSQCIISLRKCMDEVTRWKSISLEAYNAAD